MSSDCFDVKVKSVRDREVVFDVLTGTAGGIDDCFYSRSFVLHLLYDALGRAPDLVLGDWNDPVAQAARERLRQKHEAAALTKELEPTREWFVDAEWMKANLGRFVTKVDLVERRNDLGRDALDAREAEVASHFGKDGPMTSAEVAEHQRLRWERCHNYTIEVALADAKWAAHLEEGLLFPTTAADWERESGISAHSP